MAMAADEQAIVRHYTTGLDLAGILPASAVVEVRAQLALRLLQGEKVPILTRQDAAGARSEPLPRSQSDAEALADRVRSEIRLGTFRDPNAPEPAAAPAGRLTLNDVIGRYLKEYVNVPSRRERAGKEIGYQCAMLQSIEIPAAHGSKIALGFPNPSIDLVSDSHVRVHLRLELDRRPDTKPREANNETNLLERAPNGVGPDSRGTGRFGGQELPRRSRGRACAPRASGRRTARAGDF